jgi:pimeloyl-ACP methyl ester carboxylesterase
VTEQVVLVPGLWMPGAAMGLLAARLSSHGYAVRVFPYSGRRPFDANVKHLVRFARETLGGRPAHFIGHSLGGVLIFDTLNEHPDIAVRSVVLLGSPMRGCFAGRRLGEASVGRWMMGGCGVLWEERTAIWRRSEPLGVVAGTLPMGLGRALGSLPGPNDGVTCVAETAVEGMTAQVLVPLGHSVLIVSGQVAKMVESFLSTARFE